jgi:hypothetical protein
MCIIGTVSNDNLYLAEPGQYGYGLILENLSKTTIDSLTKLMIAFPKAEGNGPVAGKTPFAKDNQCLKIDCSLVDAFGRTTTPINDDPMGYRDGQPFPHVKDARSAVEISPTGPKNTICSGSHVRTGQLVAVPAHLRAYQPDWKKATEWGYSLKKLPNGVIP